MLETEISLLEISFTHISLPILPTIILWIIVRTGTCWNIKTRFRQPGTKYNPIMARTDENETRPRGGPLLSFFLWRNIFYISD